MKKLIIIGALIFSLVSMESCKTTVVAQKPNPPAVVARPPQPRPDYVWIDGEWYVVGGKYQFRQGYWAPPRGGRGWVPGHWEKKRGGWTWEKGHWR
ncbi:YXWGXW repeat-containing protein [Panacibacter sp. DH6]|uniref:YXWGXW repeat-containing protein n=1 Tax=Panacibacter microcysteis TaxID=2793269 RepID=A0A931GUV2_9BACT|nr:YXWGXW repeat-containing protein [Panacibacter microcysteis]MBG9377081.1 YXWGXW repeat-containing protein [Panacibacter microcysteis]